MGLFSRVTKGDLLALQRVIDGIHEGDTKTRLQNKHYRAEINHLRGVCRSLGERVSDLESFLKSTGVQTSLPGVVDDGEEDDYGEEEPISKEEARLRVGTNHG